MKVRAKKAGYYGEQRRKPGDVFELKGSDKLGLWMEVVGKEADADESEPAPKPRGKGKAKSDSEGMGEVI